MAKLEVVKAPMVVKVGRRKIEVERVTEKAVENATGGFFFKGHDDTVWYQVLDVEDQKWLVEQIPFVIEDKGPLPMIETEPTPKPQA